MMVVGSSSFGSYREGEDGWWSDEGCWLLQGAGGLSHGGPRFPRTAWIEEESYETFSHQSKPWFRQSTFSACLANSEMVGFKMR